MEITLFRPRDHLPDAAEALWRIVEGQAPESEPVPAPLSIAR